MLYAASICVKQFINFFFWGGGVARIIAPTGINPNIFGIRQQSVYEVVNYQSNRTINLLEATTVWSHESHFKCRWL